MKALKDMPSWKIIATMLTLFYLVGISAYLCLHYHNFVSLTIYTKPNSKLTVGDQEGVSGDTFVVSPGYIPVKAVSQGRVEVLSLALAVKGHNNTLHLDLPATPKSQQVDGAEFCAYPCINRETGLLYFLGNRGSSFVRLSPTGPATLNEERLGNITQVSWSPDGSQAVLRVEPPDGFPIAPNSPVNCEYPTSFIYRVADNSFHKVAIEYGASASSDKNGNLYYGAMEGQRSVVCKKALETPEPVTDDNLPDKNPRWKLDKDVLIPYCNVSPSGSLIAYTPSPRDDMSSNDLFILDPITGKQVQLTSSGYIYSCLWSPSSRFLLYEYRNPDTQIPEVHCYDAKTSCFTHLSIRTYIQKVTFYSNDLIIFGRPADISKALNKQISTPDSLNYGSVVSGLYGSILTPVEGVPSNYTCLVVTPNKNTLYYIVALFLHRLDISALHPLLDDLEAKGAG
jgi:hypothetical protein